MKSIKPSGLLTQMTVALLLGLSGAALLTGCKDNRPQIHETIGVLLSPEPGQEVASLQFDVSYDTGDLTLSDVTVGAAAQDAEKQLIYSVTAPGNIRVVVYGMNLNVMAEGTIANLVFEAADPLNPDTTSLGLAQTVVSDPNADLIPSAPGSPIWIQN